MKSLGYLFNRSHPRNFADCADYLKADRRRCEKSEIRLRLDQQEVIREGYIVHTFCGIFTCRLDTGVEVVFQKPYGGFLEHDGRRKREIGVKRAEERLEADLGLLVRLGVTLIVDTRSPWVPRGKRALGADVSFLQLI